MAAIDKAAIAWTIAIVAFGAGLAAIGDTSQSSTPPVATSTPPTMESTSMMESEAMMEEEAMTEEAMMEEEPMMESESMMEEEAMTEEAMMEEEPMMESESMMEEESMMESESMTEEAMMEEEVVESESMTEEAMMEEEAMTEEESMVEEEAMTEEPEVASGPQTTVVVIPLGTSVPGCETNNACYEPESVSINVGDTVSWDNVDTAAHTVTSGSPQTGPDGLFDSSLLLAGGIYEMTFDTAGSYDYFCVVHPWMIGDVQVS